MGSLTVLGNLSVDLVDDDPPSAGGCPAFAAEARSGLDVGGRVVSGRVVTRAAPADMGVFETLLAGLDVPHEVLPSTCTSSFALRYRGEERTLRVVAVGPVWEPDDLNRSAIDSRWVHVSPLLRSDFPAATLRALVERGHTLSYDGQGLVRVAETGPLLLDGRFDPRILEHLQVLKLADDEADVVAAGPFGEAAARALDVPEILVTHGSAGCDLYVAGTRTRVVARPVLGVHPTGAGDMFAVAYAAGRSAGASPTSAAAAAAELVAARLESRLSRGRTATTSSS